ncbi:MAG TPA: hypothetical protein VH142_01275 [Polyangiaceae bacterium]|nr:hypothetical protein [Polyangiaceae bacterium]
MNPRPRVFDKYVVLVPSLVASLILAHRGVPPLPRLAAACGLGLTMIAFLTVWRRIKDGKIVLPR